MDHATKKSLAAPVALRDEELGEVAGGTLYPFPMPDFTKITSQLATSVNVGGAQTAQVLGNLGGVSVIQGQAQSNSTTQSA